MSTYSVANNISEGWNNKLSSVVGEQHPSVWKLIETLQQECERVATIFYRMKEVSVQQKSVIMKHRIFHKIIVFVTEDTFIYSSTIDKVST
jgi:hypothetical protein